MDLVRAPDSVTSFARLSASSGAVHSRPTVHFRATASSSKMKLSRGVDPVLVSRLAEMTAQLDSTAASLHDARTELSAVPGLLAAAESHGRQTGRRTAFRAIQNARVIVNP